MYECDEAASETDWVSSVGTDADVVRRFVRLSTSSWRRVVDVTGDGLTSFS